MKNHEDSSAGNVRLWHKVISVSLILLLLLDAPSILWAAQDAIDSAQPSTVQNYPTPVTTPTHVKVNRTLPHFTPPSSTLKFSDSPTDQEIFTHSPFEEPLVPVGGKTTAAENAALAQALVAFTKRTERDDYSALENFLASYPQSAWRVALLTDLGWLYRQTGWYSKAMDAWQTAWNEGQADTTPAAKPIVDRALAELIVLNARIGRLDTLQQLIPLANGRNFVGSSKEKLEATKQGVVMMQSRPGISFVCGPMAVEKLRNIQDNNDPSLLKAKSLNSTQQGTSMLQLKKLAATLGMNYQVAKRSPGATVIAPAVVNWKLGHFAALLDQEGNLWHLHDPTFGNDVWVSPRALDSEASGYFLVPNGNLPTGWQAVSDKEASTVWGKGAPTATDPNNNKSGPKHHCPQPGDPDYTPCCKEDGGPGASGSTFSKGMANFSLYESVASLSLDDTPLFYAPAYGPKVEFIVSYSQREANQPSTFTYSNVGPLWTFNWFSYITDNPSSPGANVTQYMPGGGTRTYAGYSSSTSTYAADSESGSVLKITGTSSYELDFADGSKEIFGTANAATPRKVFMTQSIDPAGNALSFSYDSACRMVSVTDATGLVTTITYGSTVSSNPAYYQISQVTDPFGRTASFTYNGAGYLASSTDMLGIVSQYGYTNGIVSSLTTPYGTTTFDCGQDSSKRWVQVNEPQGSKQRMETWTGASSPISASTSPVPSGVDNSYLNYRNCFFWGRKAMLTDASGLVYTDAQITHFLHESTSVMSDQVESSKASLESRVYYSYPGQPYPYFIGTSSFPSRVVRILDNGHTQESDYTYNSIGKITQKTDPAGRITNYTYASNNVDLTQITQKNGSSNDVLFSATYNSQHEPLTVTDASGQTTTYTYNTNGTLATVTNAKSETTTYAYNGSGQLTSVTGPVTDATVSFTYDSYGRVRTTTDLNGYVKTYDYDALNRVTKVTYPDSTYDQFVYTNLDLTLSKDRQNRWTRNFYNALQQLVGTEDPQGRVTTYERCICGELKGLVDANGHRTSWNQDLEGRTTSKTFADGSAYAYTYESRSNRLKTVTDPKSQVATYTYNDDDTVNQVAYTGSGVSTPTVSFAYDTVYPRITGMTDGTGSTSYSYNSVWASGAAITGGGRLHTETGPLGSTAAITYSYDELGRTTGTSINGTASTVSYDSLGRMTGAGNVLGNFTYGYYGTTPRLHTVSNDQNGLNTSYSYQSGSGQDFRLTDISNYSTGTTVLSKFDYSYNPSGSIATKQEQTDSNTPTLWTYGYDNADQLTSAVRTDTSTSAVLSRYVYGYDLAGNRTSEQVGLSVTSTSVNNLNQITSTSAGGSLQFTGTTSKPSQVTVAGSTATYANSYSTNFSGVANVTTGTNTLAVVATDVNGNAATNNYQVVVPTGTGTSPTYDGNGNLTSNGNGQAYTWDAKNELMSITYSSGVNSGNHTEFTYDGLGRRVKIADLTGTTIGAGSPISSSSVKQFVWVGTSPAEERDASNAVTKRFLPQGEQISGTKYYYTKDHLGSIREMVDNSTTIQARYDYDPYGRVTKISGSLDADFQYTGYYEHTFSGLNLTLFRAYDSNTGKWLSRDPLKDVERSQGPNLYEYVRNNPIIFNDAFGLNAGTFKNGTSNGCPCGYHPEPALDLKGADNVGNFMTGGAINGGNYIGAIIVYIISRISGPLGNVYAETVLLESSIGAIGGKCVSDTGPYQQ